MNPVRSAVMLAVLAAFAHPAGTQRSAVPADAPSVTVRRWSTEDSLPQNTVNAIAQTPDGYLWLATFGGLVRFDGLHFTVFSSRDAPDIGSDRSTTLAADQAGDLWVGTEYGVVHKRGATFRTYTTADGLPADLIVTVHATADGEIWVSTAGGVARWRRDRFERVEAAGVLSGSTPREIAHDDRGAVWVRFDAGLGRFDPAVGQFRGDGVPIPPSEMTLLGTDRDGAVWFGTAAGVARWVGGRLTHFGRDAGFRPDPRFSAMAQGANGIYWFASQGQGVWSLDMEGPSPQAHPHAIVPGETDVIAKTVFADREGIIWVGTNVDGLASLRPRLFRTVPLETASPTAAPTAIMEDAQGRVWLGVNCDALNVMERGVVRRFRTSSGEEVSCVWSLGEDRQGGIWMGTWGEGLYRWRGDTLRRFAMADGLAHGVVMALTTDRDGRVWAGTLERGITIFDGDRLTTVDTSDGLVHNRVNVLAQDADGAMWIGTLRGLSRWADGRITSYTTADGLAHDYVRALHHDADGVLWIGTYGGGLTRYADGRFTRIASPEGLFDDVVSSIIETNDGFLWMTGNRGVFRVRRGDLNALAAGQRDAVHSIAYSVADGLPAAETNGGFQPASWRSRDGRLWFPTIKGVAVVDPTRATTNPVPPTVVIERVRVDGRPIEPADRLQLASGPHTIEIGYTALSTAAPEHLVFRFRLDGVDEDWVGVGERRFAYYNQVGAGTHRFRVTAANRDGVWHPDGATLVFAVPRPVPQTWWFRSAVALAILGLAGFGVRLRSVRQAHLVRREFARRILEGQEAERKRIAAELHDSVGQDLLVVKNRAMLALQSPETRGQMRAQLEAMSDVLSETITRTRQLAHDLRPAALDRLGLAAAVRANVEKVATGSRIHFVVDVREVDGLLPPEAAISVFRIVQEGTQNILKHSTATEARVSLGRVRSRVALVISDNGRGMQAGDGGGRGFGLESISERVLLLGGTMQVRSTPGAGMTLAITLPILPPPKAP